MKLWDLRKLKNFKTLQLEDGYEVEGLSFDQSGTYLAVAGTDVRYARHSFNAGNKETFKFGVFCD